MTPYKLLFGDCLSSFREVNNESVHLVLTSPPYNCGKAYGSFLDKLSWDAYWDFTKAWLRESFRVLKPRCRLAVNLPWWMLKKPRRDVPFAFKQAAYEIGFLFLDKVIWIKGDATNIHTSGGFSGGGSGWGTYMSPSGPSIRCASEPILIFAKGKRGRGVISGEGFGKCVKGDMTKEEWMEWTKDVWFVRGASSKHHPAVFPQEIPKRLIKLYTYQKEFVLDPFMGIGTTGTVCHATSRHFIGMEQDPTFFQIANDQLEVLCSNSS